MKKCSACGQPHERPAKKCKVCVDKETARQKKQYQERLTKGLCPRCGDQPIEGSKHCSKCKIRVRDKDRKVRSKRLDDGKCIYCGKNPSEDGRKMCNRCWLRLRNLHQNRIDRLNKLDLCVRCGRFSQLPGVTRCGNLHITCQSCYLKHISQSNLGSRKYADALLAKLEGQNYKCSYTGDNLILGDNAWVDHIMPRSRFPELAGDIDNIEWVTEAVNRMKQNQMPDEFLSLIKQIHDYRSL
jgi:NMD protein affecting ribosome stability and mRNA decay